MQRIPPKGKKCLCGYSRYIKTPHEAKERRRNKHFEVKETFKSFTSGSWKETTFKVSTEQPAEVPKQTKQMTTVTPEQERELKKSYAVVARQEAERKVKEDWEALVAAKKDQGNVRKESPESSTSECLRNTKNRKETNAKFKVIRLNRAIPTPKPEVILTPAPRERAEQEGRRDEVDEGERRPSQSKKGR